jgi:two-component system, NarL family, response regulator LiaR
MMRDGMVLMIRTTWPDGFCEVANDYLTVVGKLEAPSVDTHFDAVILDLRMPGMRGVESVAHIVQLAVGTPVIVCTALEDPSLVQRLQTSGIYSVVNKKTGAEELLKHVHAALLLPRGTFESKDYKNTALALNNPNIANMSGSAMLTVRQREILKMLHTGKPSKVIASQLGIGLGTIKSHLHTLYSLMGVSTRSEAIVKSQNWLL